MWSKQNATERTRGDERGCLNACQDLLNLCMKRGRCLNACQFLEAEKSLINFQNAIDRRTKI